jgi:hypothetical protein
LNIRIPSILAAATLLSATFLHGATAPQARITLVERNAAPGAQANAQSSVNSNIQSNVVRKQMPGQPDHEAYRFSQQVHVGSPVTEMVEIAFHAATTLKSIEANNDFSVAGTSCTMGRTYNEGDSCSVSVTLDPKGPGKRAGLLTFNTEESASPEVVGLQGSTLGAVISFIPAQINTLPQSMPNGKPLLNDPRNIVVDQGDNLYVADGFLIEGGTTGGVVYMMDSSNVMQMLVGGGPTKPDAGGDAIPNSSTFLTQPGGIAVDSFLDLFTPDGDTGALYETTRGYTYTIAGLGNTPAEDCTSTPCTSLSTLLYTPSWVNVDDDQNVFVNDDFGYYVIPPGGKLSAYTQAQTRTVQPGFAFGLDSTDDLYALDPAAFNPNAVCMIDGVNPGTAFEWEVAGSGICGYAGNNIRSQSAEIGSFITGYAFDAAGDMYFTDPNNGVIRRVDEYNGLIRTAAGNPNLTNFYTGDGGPATSAGMDDPDGVAVDSLGSIYTASNDTNIEGSPSFVIRKIGPAGQVNFPTEVVGVSSAVYTALLTNTGNDNLMVSNQILGGADPGDFIPDPYTSSCVWGQPLLPGHSCQLGFSFKPKAAGFRSAAVTFVDNTATFQNILYLNGYSLAAAVTPTVTVTSPTSGETFILGSNPSGGATVSNSITAVNVPPTGTVTLSIYNTANNTVVERFSGLTLSPTGAQGTSAILSTALGHLSVGTYSIQAAYSGDNLDLAASSTAVPFSIVQVTPAVTITAPAANSTVIAGAETATVTVSNAGLTPAPPAAPTGKITLTLLDVTTSVTKTIIGTLVQGSSGVSSVSIALGSLTAGSYNLTAAYGGDVPDTAATSTMDPFTVAQVTPAVTVTSPTPNTYTYGTEFKFAASVSNAGLIPTDPSSPTGTVTFTLTPLTGSSTTPVTYGPYTLTVGAGGVSTALDPTQLELKVASYELTASYSGDTADAAVTGGGEMFFSVVPATPAITWATPSFVYTGTSLSATQLDAVAKYNGAVVPGAYVYNPPSGTVMNTAGTIPLDVTFTPTDNVDYTTATGTVNLLVETQIQSAPITITWLSSAKNPAVSGLPVELTVVVQPASGKVTPTGTVTLKEDGKTLKSAELSGGQAKVSLSNLAPGIHSIVATYSGDAQNGASTSEPVKQVVNELILNPQGTHVVNPDSAR